MPYIIAEPCVGVCDTACVDVCPVDCIDGPTTGSLEEIQQVKEEGGEDALVEKFGDEIQLYIDPEECIDCGACEPECPVEAIFEEDEVPEKWEHYVQLNADVCANR